MENNKKELINWAIDHFNKNLEIIEQRWNIFEKQPYFDYKVNISIQENIYEGRGINLSQKNALNAAIGEAIERYAISYNNLGSSNGCAFHTDLNIAIANAQNEILERHFVMLFTLGYWNQEKIDKSRYPQEINILIEALKSKGIKFDFYLLQSSSSSSVILCQANGIEANKPFGLIFGSSCSSSQDQSLIKSFKEVLINVVAHLNNNLKSITYDNFLKLKSHTPFDHLELYLDLNFAQKYLHDRKFEKMSLEIPSLELFENKIVSHPFDSLFSVVKSKHPNCLSPVWGPIGNNYIVNNNNFNFPFILP
jgi:hypothetical protein